MNTLNFHVQFSPLYYFVSVSAVLSKLFIYIITISFLKFPFSSIAFKGICVFEKTKGLTIRAKSFLKLNA